MQLRADIGDAGKCQHVIVAEVDRAAGRGGKQRIKFPRRKPGTIVGMRDIDLVQLDFTEVGDGDVAGAEHELVGAAEPGQRVEHLAVAETTIEGVGAGVAGELIAELRAEQVGDI